ncbi:MAG: aminoacyl-tRNA hydrolase [Nitrospirota bacterium]
MKCVVGLGNPGEQYAATRHNVGFLVAEAVAAACAIRLRSMGGPAVAGRGVLAGEEVWIAEPQGYMNRSGAAVRWLLNETGAGPDALLVVHDDLDLPLGQLRFKRRGGHGGHNGVRSIIEALGTNEFLRLKVGIGRPSAGSESADYVLERFSRDEEPVVAGVVERAREAVTVALTDGAGVAMNRFHAEGSGTGE